MFGSAKVKYLWRVLLHSLKRVASERFTCLWTDYALFFQLQTLAFKSPVNSEALHRSLDWSTIRKRRHKQGSCCKDILEDSQHFFIISPHAAGGDVGDWLDRPPMKLRSKTLETSGNCKRMQKDERSKCVPLIGLIPDTFWRKPA